MIVVNIIGILAIALYPSLSNYIERWRRVEERALAKGFIEMLQEYITDNGKMLTQHGSWQCITAWYISTSEYVDHGYAECPSSWFSYYNSSLTTYFQSSSRWKLLLQKRDEFCKRRIPLAECAMDFMYLWDYPPASYASWFGNWIFQGESPMDTQKRWRVFWQVPLGTDYYDKTWWNHGDWTSHGDQTLVANARCAPGVVITITQYDAPWQDYNYVECMYLLE